MWHSSVANSGAWNMRRNLSNWPRSVGALQAWWCVNLVFSPLQLLQLGTAHPK